jgi:hypothetical protein
VRRAANNGKLFMPVLFLHGAYLLRLRDHDIEGRRANAA